jgi:hypothetical protein
LVWTSTGLSAILTYFMTFFSSSKQFLGQ